MFISTHYPLRVFLSRSDDLIELQGSWYIWLDSRIYSYLFPASFQKDSMLPGLTFTIIVMYRIFQLKKVVFSMSQNEIAFYNKPKSLPFTTLTLLIYLVIGVLEELQSASFPVTLQGLFILRGNWVAVFLYHRIIPCLSALGSSVGEPPDEAVLAEAPPDPLTSSYSGENVLLWEHAVDWVFLILISLYPFCKKTFFILAHKVPSLGTPGLLLICFSAL